MAAALVTSRPSPAIQRATAIVELVQIRSKLPCTGGSTTWPEWLVCSTVSASTYPARATTASPSRRNSSASCSSKDAGPAETGLRSCRLLERCIDMSFTTSTHGGGRICIGARTSGLMDARAHSTGCGVGPAGA